MSVTKLNANSFHSGVELPWLNRLLLTIVVSICVHSGPELKATARFEAAPRPTLSSSVSSALAREVKPHWRTERCSSFRRCMVERSFGVEGCPATVTGSCSLSDILIVTARTMIGGGTSGRVSVGDGVASAHGRRSAKDGRTMDDGVASGHGRRRTTGPGKRNKPALCFRCCACQVPRAHTAVP